MGGTSIQGCITSKGREGDKGQVVVLILDLRHEQLIVRVNASCETAFLILHSVGFCLKEYVFQFRQSYVNPRILSYKNKNPKVENRAKNG